MFYISLSIWILFLSYNTVNLLSAEGYTASKRWSQNLNSDRLTPKYKPLSLYNAPPLWICHLRFYYPLRSLIKKSLGSVKWPCSRNWVRGQEFNFYFGGIFYETQKFFQICKWSKTLLGYPSVLALETLWLINQCKKYLYWNFLIAIVTTPPSPLRIKSHIMDTLLESEKLIHWALSPLVSPRELSWKYFSKVLVLFSLMYITNFD